MIEQGYLTSRQLADRWGVSRRTIDRLATSGALTATWFGYGCRLRRFGLDQVRAAERAGMADEAATATQERVRAAAARRGAERKAKAAVAADPQPTLAAG